MKRLPKILLNSKNMNQRNMSGPFTVDNVAKEIKVNNLGEGEYICIVQLDQGLHCDEPNYVNPYICENTCQPVCLCCKNYSHTVDKSGVYAVLKKGKIGNPHVTVTAVKHIK